MTGLLFDTNVLLDLATKDPQWFTWSEFQFRAAVRSGLVHINPIVYAELAPAFPSEQDLNEWLDHEVFERLPLPYAAGWLAAQAYKEYRSRGGSRNRLLPDFYIGAHAEVTGLTIVTRDMSHYRAYFPSVPLIAP